MIIYPESNCTAMTIRILLIIVYFLNTIDLSAQSKLHSEITREVKVNNPLLIGELRKNLIVSEKNVYVCHITKYDNKTCYKLMEIGYTSQLKDTPSSVYTIVNENIIFIQTGIEDVIENQKFFQEVALPLTKGRIINDILPNGSKNLDIVPYAGYDPIDITIIIEKGKVSVIKESQP